MKTASLLFSVFLFSICFPGCHPKPAENPFMNEVIKKFGKNGQACFDRDGSTYCIAKASLQSRPIQVNDLMRPNEKLVLCIQSSGRLTDCKEVSPYTCEPMSGGQCHCQGIEDCFYLSNLDGCKNGSCDCEQGDCCCTQQS